MPSDNREAVEQAIADKMAAIGQANTEIRELRRQWAASAEPIEDYMLTGQGGPVSLSALFGEQDDLIVIHNMGRGCAYCTLWADGFASALPHIESRAAFVLTSPDDPATQREFAASRGWPFRMVSIEGSRFGQDMGFVTESGDYWPGVSTFRRRPDGSIVRVGKDFFGPGDVYCGVWHFFDLLEGGANGWYPQFSYDQG
jgi:predicted dithiol-disulfide oxidoreductase (DUF899 family)